MCVSVFLRVFVFSCVLCFYTLWCPNVPPGVESGRSDHFVIHFSDVIGMRQSLCNFAEGQVRLEWFKICYVMVVKSDRVLVYAVNKSLCVKRQNKNPRVNKNNNASVLMRQMKLVWPLPVLKLQNVSLLLEICCSPWWISSLTNVSASEPFLNEQTT